MNAWPLTTPVAFFIFNRPDTTERVFAAIAQARPPMLLVVADGPRESVPGEAAKCAATRAIIERVDWPCEVLTCFADRNLGCRRRVSSGLDWVFGTVEEAIILEDDCLPHPSFFRFCDELLERYRNDERVAQISGDNFQCGSSRIADSYYFSQYNHIWGWASWRRSWQHYDVNMQSWPQMRDSGYVRTRIGDPWVARIWEAAFDATYQGKIDTWDYQWTFSCWARGALTVLPAVNLISNIGFGPSATHTKKGSKIAELPVMPLAFPLQHPQSPVHNVQADLYTERTLYRPPWRTRLVSGSVEMLRRLAG